MGPPRVPIGPQQPPQVQTQQQAQPLAWGTYFGVPYPIYMAPTTEMTSTAQQQQSSSVHPTRPLDHPASSIPCSSGAPVHPSAGGGVSNQQVPQVPAAGVPSYEPVFPVQSIGGFRLGGLPSNHIRTGSNRMPVGGWKGGGPAPKVGDFSSTPAPPPTSMEESSVAEHLTMSSLSLQHTTLKTLNSLPPMEMEGPGFRLMQQMGYRIGEGLGKRSNGQLEPLKVQVKLDTKGLAASDERVRSKKTAVNVLPWGWDQGEKNPVSQLLEVCQSQGWTTPAFDFHEEGPPNARRWICTARLNGVDYRSAISAKRKKNAKADACLVILNTLKGGLVVGGRRTGEEASSAM